MPTADQLAALSDAADERKAFAEAERQRQSALLALLSTRDARRSTKSFETRLRKAGAERDDAIKRLDAARARVLAGGTGAELLDRDLPAALLPIRLETRYKGDVLLVRIFPDDIHVDGHEPELTANEQRWRLDYLKRLDKSTDRAPWLAAWRDLVARVGVYRAAYLALLPADPAKERRSSAWSRSVRARLMPDKFVAYVWTTRSAVPIVVPAPALVAEPLVLSPDPMRADPADSSPMGEAAEWLHDFDTAETVGMAIRIPLGSAGATVERLVVIGVRGTVNPDDQAAELTALLRAHAHTGGLDLPVPGSPTNALPGQRPTYSSRPDPDTVYADQIEYSIRGGARLRRLPKYVRQATGGVLSLDRRAASVQMAMAFGIDADALGYVPGAGDVTLALEEAMRIMLRACFEFQAQCAFAPSVPASDVSRFFDRFLACAALGPLPTLQVGAQPYGVLPILAEGGLPRDSGTAAVLDRLDALRSAVFDDARARVVRTGNSAGQDPGAVMIDILRRDAITRELRVRAIIQQELADAIADRLDEPGRIVVEEKRANAAALLDALGIADPDLAAVVHDLLLNDAVLIQRPLVAPPNAIGSERPATYLSWLHTLALDSLLTNTYPEGRPTSLLFEMARRAVLEAADDDARTTLVEDGGVDPHSFDSATGGLGSPEWRLGHPAPLDPSKTIAQRLDDRTAPEGRKILQVFQALEAMTGTPQDSLEALLRGAVGLLSHRLDAWYTMMATERLRTIRESVPQGRSTAEHYLRGLAVGAYGWVEQIQRTGAQPSAGYVHAPSSQHAATAGVLLSADLAHRAAGHGSAFAVDLSSQRVRLALNLIEGVRNEQPLSALLGYRMERTLVNAGQTAPALVSRLRGLAPLVANRLTPSTQPVESVAADNVVDGVALLRLATADGQNAPSVASLQRRLGSLDATQEAALLAALNEAADALDAVQDVLLAEGVYQLVGGATARVSAAVDSVSGAFVPPPEVEVVRTPQMGIATTHRVMLTVDPAARAAGWGAATPRAAASPGLDSLASQWLPTPDRIRLRAKYGGSTGIELELSLAELLSDAEGAGLTELGLSAIDLVLSADPLGAGASGALDTRLRALASQTRPTAVDDPAIDLDFGRAEGWDPSIVSMSEVLHFARELRWLLLNTRNVQPKDLFVASSANQGVADARIAAARLAVTAARTALTTALGAGATVVDQTRALFGAGLCGVSVNPEVVPLKGQLLAALAELDARIATPVDPAGDMVGEFRSLFGRDFPAVVPLTLADDTLVTGFAQDLGATPEAIRSFIACAARVRERIGRLDTVLGYAEAFALEWGSSYTVNVGQNPREPGEQWTALPGRVAAGRVSILAVSPGDVGAVSATSLEGLLLDEWNEIIPAVDADTSVAFHYNAPSSAAPNAILLCAMPAGREEWDMDTLLSAVLQGLDLAKLRAVDSDLLGPAGQLLPTLLLDDDAFEASFAEMVTRPPSRARTRPLKVR